jgi:phage/plasmid primase-like uncharacterized protein
MNNLNLSSHDIIRMARTEIANIASNVGVDWLASESKLSSSKNGFHCAPVEKKRKGAVKGWFTEKTTKYGTEYPIIVFNNIADGATATFSGFEFLLNNGYFDKKNTSTHYPSKPIATAVITPSPNEKLCSCGKHFTPKQLHHLVCPDCFQFTLRLNNFKENAALYSSLPPVNDSAYLTRKKIKINDFPLNHGIKQGIDKRGSFIMIALTDGQCITGFQKIYDSKFTDNNGKLRDKDFVFYPLKDGTYKKGSYYVIGNIDDIEHGVNFVEGLSTGLTVYKYTGRVTIVCLDAGNIEPVLSRFSHITKKYVYADNDANNENGNVGIYHALLAVRKHGGRVFVPTFNGQKVDFNDLESVHNLDAKEIKKQLTTRNNSNEIQYSKAIIFKYVPASELKNLALELCYKAVEKITTRKEFHYQRKVLQALFDSRNFKEFKAKNVLLKLLRNILHTIVRDNCFKPDKNARIIDITGMSNQQIAESIKELDGLIIDSRGMGKGKTELMTFIAKLFSNTGITHNDVKRFFFKSGGTENEWQRVNNLPSEFAEWEAETPSYKKVMMYIAHRVSLISSAANRLDFNHYESTKNLLPDTLAICVNSILKFDGVTPDLLFIDEFRQLLEHLHIGTVDNRKEVNYQLIKLINNSTLAIIADADFNQASYEWLKNNCPDKKIYYLNDKSSNKTLGKTINLLPINGNSVPNLINKAIDTIKINGSCFLAFDSINQAEKAYRNIILNTNSDRVLLVTSENKDNERQRAFLNNPNDECLKYDVIIHTPVISSGVSITSRTFDFVGAGFCGVITPNQMLQTIARVRTATTVEVALIPRNDEKLSTNKLDLIDGEIIKRSRFLDSGNIINQLTDFDHYRLDLRVSTNNALNNFSQYFQILAQIKGYSLSLLDDNKESRKLTVTSKDVKGAICTEINSSTELTWREFNQLENKTATTQEESNSMDKYLTREMTGKEYEDLTNDDIQFFKYEHGQSKISNFELVDADIEDLKQDDIDNHAKRERVSSKVSKHIIISYIITTLKSNNSVVNHELIQRCLRYLHENHREISANGNGLGNFSKLSTNTQTLIAFLKKCGYELVETGRKSTGGRERIYELRPNELVARYAINRKRRRELAKAFD